MKYHDNIDPKATQKVESQIRIVASNSAILLGSELNQAMNEAEKAARDNGGEICGLLVDNGNFLELVPLKNKSKTGGSFSFYVTEVRAVQAEIELSNREIVGTFHSHPVGLAKPGGADIRHSVDDSLMLIFDVSLQKHALWHVRDNAAAPLKFTVL